MRHHTTTRRVGRLAAAAAVGAAALIALAPAAFADTSTATAQALDLTVAGSPLVATTPASASNGGTGPAVLNTGSTTGVLSGQSTITAGVLVQQALANPDGTSAACAGLVGNGGSIQIGSNGDCVVTGAAAGGVTINLPDLLVLKATAILEECQASSNGTATAQAQLVDAAVFLGSSPTPLVSLPLNPGAGQSVNALLLALNLNSQTTPTAGEITGTAFQLSVLNTINLNIGEVSCGPNASTSTTSVFPLKSLPIAGGTAVVLAAGGLLWYRRRGHRMAQG